MNYFAIIPAAGRSARMGDAIPKQYLKVQGKTILEHSIASLLAIPEIKKIVVVIALNDSEWLRLPFIHEPRVVSVVGGGERQASVLNGLMALDSDARADDWILVHDAARPCLQKEDIWNLISALSEHPVGGCLGTPVRDTLKKCSLEGEIQETVSRQQLWRALTPQMFRFRMLQEALISTMGNPLVTDEASAIELAGFVPRIVAGRADNIKLTLPEDLELIERYFALLNTTI